MKKTEHAEYSFRKLNFLEKLQRTQTMFITYTLTPCCNCYTFSKIIGSLGFCFKTFQELPSQVFQNDPFFPQINPFTVCAATLPDGQSMEIDPSLRSMGAHWFWLPSCPSAAALQNLLKTIPLPGTFASAIFVDLGNLWQTTMMPCVANCQNIVCHLKLSTDSG